MTGEDEEEELIPATPDPSIGSKQKRGEIHRMTGKTLNLLFNDIASADECGDNVLDDILVEDKDKDISSYCQQSVDILVQGGQTPGANIITQEETLSARGEDARTSTPSCQLDRTSPTDKEEESDRKDNLGDHL